MPLAFRFYIFIALCSILSAGELDSLRTWTSQEGDTLQATLIDSDSTAQTSRMRREDGRIFTMPWSRLSDADQSLLSAQFETTAAPIEAAPTTTATIELPKSFKLKRVPMVKQKGNFCVPASATMIAGFHGIKTDQDEIAQLSSEASISNEGTYPSDMSLAMEKLGFDGRTLRWDSEESFLSNALPAIRRALVETGPIYISFRSGVFGDMGHGCVIVGYNDRREEMNFYNPWGNEFKKDYADVATESFAVVLFDPPGQSPIASDTFITQIQEEVPRFDGDFLALASRLTQANRPYELIWCNRRDTRDSKRFAVDTARRDGRKILELSFRRNPAVLIPGSPDGIIKKYYFVTRPPEGGASYMVREITEQGWSPVSIKTLGNLTREWPTLLTVPNQTEQVWELPMIELNGE